MQSAAAWEIGCYLKRHAREKQYYRYGPVFRSSCAPGLDNGLVDLLGLGGSVGRTQQSHAASISVLPVVTSQDARFDDVHDVASEAIWSDSREIQEFLTLVLPSELLLNSSQDVLDLATQVLIAQVLAEFSLQ